MKSKRSFTRSLWSWFFAVALLAPVFADAAFAQEAAKPFARVKDPSVRRSLFEAWRAQHKSPSSAAAQTPQGVLVTPIVGRASMVINGAGTTVYTKNFLGTNATCDADLRDAAEWIATTAHALNDHVRPTAAPGNKFMATNAGTTGAVEPVWPAAFGATVGDGSITWVNVGQSWTAARAYTVGMVAESVAVSPYRLGFNFQATTSGTSGATEPIWPTTAGATVNDNGVIWKAIGFYPGSFTGCNAMQIVSRASGGAETVLAAEGSPIGANGTQLMGWGEFIAMNASGQAAFRAEMAGYLRNDDESSAGIFTAGPGAGTLAMVAASNTTIGGRSACGFSTMVGMNGAGQVLMDALAPRHLATWQVDTSYTSGTSVYPTVASGLAFQAQSNGLSGLVEPTWPTSPGQLVIDGTVTWRGVVADCDENDHGLVRFTPPSTNALLVSVGSTVGTPSATVLGFGSDDDSQLVGNCGVPCTYENIDGFMNATGHVPVVLKLSDGTQGVFNFTGPGTATQVVRSGGAITAIGPRTSINNGDQVVYRATSGGVDRLFRFTPPSTTTTIVSVGDVVSASTITALGAFTDINNSGNVVFQGSTAAGDAFYYWNGAVTQVATGPANTLAAEMITVNDSNLVAYVTGSGAPEGAGKGSQGHETGGIFLWTTAGGSTKAIAVGDVISAATVTKIYAQHTSFARRQLSSAGCVATAYTILTDDAEMNCREGNPAANCYGGGSPRLFVSCGAVCPVITLAPPTLPGATQGQAYSQSIVASGGTAPYTYAVTLGTLPAGLTLSAGGLLSGTPTVTGTFPFTVTATDASTCTGLQAYSLVVGGPTQVTVLINPPSRTVVVGNTSNLTVSINIPQSTDTVVTLSSANPAIVAVPPTVTILANQTSALFTVNGVTVGGPVTITANLPASFQAPPATAAVTVAAAAAANVPTLSGWALALLGLMLAAAAVLLMRR